MKDDSDEKRGRMKYKISPKFDKSLQQEMEFVSYELVKKRRGKERKISFHHIKITAKTMSK